MSFSTTAQIDAEQLTIQEYIKKHYNDESALFLVIRAPDRFDTELILPIEAGFQFMKLLAISETVQHTPGSPIKLTPIQDHFTFGLMPPEAYAKLKMSTLLTQRSRG